MTNKGFTLAEILIVMVILGVVARLAIPVYTGSMEDARLNEARTSLGVILMGERIFRARNGAFWLPGNTTAANIDTNLNSELLPQFYNNDWNIVVHASGFIATVCRAAGTGCHTMDANGTFT